jgi:hypothetical protein
MSSHDDPETVYNVAVATHNAEPSDIVVVGMEEDGAPNDDGPNVDDGGEIKEKDVESSADAVTAVAATEVPMEGESVHDGTGHPQESEVAEVADPGTAQSVAADANAGETGPQAAPEGVVGAEHENAVDEAAPAEPDAAMAEEVPPVVPDEEELGEPIEDPAEMDVLSGRGAAVNSRPGNRKFRALCFAHKPHFEAGNHAAKRRIATEIVALMFRPTDGAEPSRFLKRRVGDRGPYYAMTEEQAILKAQQVMRDYKRPDRVAARELLAQNGNARKRTRQVESTPMIDVVSRSTAPVMHRWRRATVCVVCLAFLAGDFICCSHCCCPSDCHFLSHTQFFTLTSPFRIHRRNPSSKIPLVFTPTTS